MPYIEYTDEQKERANSVDLVELLERRGEKLKKDFNDYRWVSGHTSVTIRGNQWYRHSADRGGYPVGFCMEFLGMDYQEAMTFLLGGDAPQIDCSKPPPEPKEFILPKANRTMYRLYAYLTQTRGIAPDVVTEFVHQRKIFEDADYHNVVFVGKDKNGDAKWAGKKSTNSFGQSYRGNVAGSDKRYSFNHVGAGTSLFVFEAPIDMMSYITMYPTGWKEQNYISLDGVAEKPLLHFLSRNPHITDVYLCLDNDRAGQEANERIMQTLAEHGLRVEILMPELKDWNADVLSQKSVELEVTTG